MLKSVSIIILALGMAMSASADVVSNCFKVVDYSVCWHVECTLDGFTNALDIAIDDNAHNGFRAGDHGSQPYAYFAAVESDETIDAGTFIRMTGMVEFLEQSDFIVAFAIGCTERNRIDGNFGWVHLACEGGTIVLKGGAINTTRGAALVARGFQGVDDGPDDIEKLSERLDDIILQWDFSTVRDRDSIYTVSQSGSHRATNLCFSKSSSRNTPTSNVMWYNSHV